MNESASILLIDDEPDVLEAYKIMLEESGYNVLTAQTGKDALEILKEYPAAVCLIDLRLKDENGLNISRELIQADPLLKIMVITAYPTCDTAVDAIRMGIFDYISKTEAPPAILKRIENALSVRAGELDGMNRKAILNKKNMALICSHTLVRGGIESFCREYPSYHLLQTAPSHHYLKQADFNHKIDLVLICRNCYISAIHAGEVSGIPRLASFFPNGRIVIVNSTCNDEEIIEFIKNGVKGFLVENISRDGMKKAFDAVLNNELWVNRAIMGKLVHSLLEESPSSQSREIPPKPANWGNLSRREVEIIQGMASGLSNTEISDKYFISENTVKIHISHIFKKLNVKSRTQAVVKAMEAHFI